MTNRLPRESQPSAVQKVPPHEARYFASLAEGRFEIPCCEDCGQWHFYPRVMCPFCYSESLRWKQPSGKGTIYSSTTVRRPDGADYCVCLVDLDEGPRLMSTVVDIPALQIRIGQKVRAGVSVTDGQGLLVFRLQGSAE